ncbi:MAG: hypothetical protein GY767_22700 [Shimia sp.]|nr:hypothetical protein [Shimia sp.]
MITQWLMLETALNELYAREAAGPPSAEARAAFDARAASTGNSRVDRILSIAGSKAEISISGVLTKHADFWAYYYGGGNTAYMDIIAAMAAAENNPTVTNVDFYVDSPGGSIDGLFDAIAAMQLMTKPTRAIVSGVAASAAFAFAAAAGTIVAHNAADILGSVGIVTTMRVNPNAVTITSTDAPKKRPDVTTEEGKAVVRGELDAIHELFVDVIATGRGTTARQVNADYGEGGVVLAGEALKRGMIDAIGFEDEDLDITTASTGGTTEGKSMDLTTLKAEHPAVFAAAKAEGAAEELGRVQAHLTLGKASGAMDTAIEAIDAGAALTDKYQAAYMAANMAKTQTTQRATDEATIAAAANGAATATGAAAITAAEAQENADVEAFRNGEYR